MGENIEVFYTGGGIWLAEVDANEEEYAVVSSEASEFLALYKKVEEDDEKYFPEDMVLAQNKAELSPNLRALYDRLLSELKKEVEV